jgi:hypothetical protein
MVSSAANAGTLNNDAASNVLVSAELASKFLFMSLILNGFVFTKTSHRAEKRKLTYQPSVTSINTK